MQARNWILLVLAGFIALLAVMFANSYFSSVEKRQQTIAEEQKLSRIVVASQDLAFGMPLGVQNLRLANWPAKSVPEGAFTSIAAATKDNRVALRPIVVGEPVLASKVSGTDGRATLSANLPFGKLAFAVSVNEVTGVGGFVRPGDRVDVLLTRIVPGAESGSSDRMTDVVLEAVPVLGIDQVQDESQTKPATAKTATLEVDTVGAQKLALAAQMGQLTLALRNVADNGGGIHTTVLPRQLTTKNFYFSAHRPAPQYAPAMPPARLPSVASTLLPRFKGPTMVVYRGIQPSEYEVLHGW
jgi:pilus assembly protein CpaB